MRKRRGVSPRFLRAIALCLIRVRLGIGADGPWHCGARALCDCGGSRICAHMRAASESTRRASRHTGPHGRRRGRRTKATSDRTHLFLSHNFPLSGWGKMLILASPTIARPFEREAVTDHPATKIAMHGRTAARGDSAITFARCRAPERRSFDQPVAMRPGSGDLSRQFRQMSASGLSAGIGAGMTIAACFIPFARADGGKADVIAFRAPDRPVTIPNGNRSTNE